MYFSFVYLTGVIILFLTSLPVSIEHGAALGGLIVAMIVIGLGTGGIKANVAPLIAEQYTNTNQKIRVEKNGERVIVDPATTIQRVFMVGLLHCAINLTDFDHRSSISVSTWVLYLRSQPRKWRKTPAFGRHTYFV